MPKKTFDAVMDAGSHLLVQVKDNQPSLAAALEDLAANSAPTDTHVDKGPLERGRQETRTTEVFVAGETLGLTEWMDSACLAVRTTRIVHRRDTATGMWRTTREVVWHVTDLEDCSAAFLAHAIRGHWGIENRLHRVRDGAMREDTSRIRKNPGIFATLLSFGLNILRFNRVGNIQNGCYENALSVEAMLSYRGL